MTPQVQAWRDRLKCNVARVDHIFENALLEALETLSPEGATAWLAGADRVCALGRGTELVLIFLDEIPEVVRHSDEDIIPEIAEMAALLSEYAVPRAISPFLATLPAVARRLGSANLLRSWVKTCPAHGDRGGKGHAALGPDCAIPGLASCPWAGLRTGSNTACGFTVNIRTGYRTTSAYNRPMPRRCWCVNALAPFSWTTTGSCACFNARCLTPNFDFRPFSEAFDTDRKPPPAYKPPRHACAGCLRNLGRGFGDQSVPRDDRTYDGTQDLVRAVSGR